MISKEKFLRMISINRDDLYSGLFEYRQVNKEHIAVLKEDLIGMQNKCDEL